MKINDSHCQQQPSINKNITEQLLRARPYFRYWGYRSEQNRKKAHSHRVYILIEIREEKIIYEKSYSTLKGDKYYAEKRRKGKKVYCKVRRCVILNVIIRVGFIEKEVFEHCLYSRQRKLIHKGGL